LADPKRNPIAQAALGDEWEGIHRRSESPEVLARSPGLRNLFPPSCVPKNAHTGRAPRPCKKKSPAG